MNIDADLDKWIRELCQRKTEFIKDQFVIFSARLKALKAESDELFIERVLREIHEHPFPFDDSVNIDEIFLNPDIHQLYESIFDPEFNHSEIELDEIKTLLSALYIFYNRLVPEMYPLEIDLIMKADFALAKVACSVEGYNNWIMSIVNRRRQNRTRI